MSFYQIIIGILFVSCLVSVYVLHSCCYFIIIIIVVVVVVVVVVGLEIRFRLLIWLILFTRNKQWQLLLLQMDLFPGVCH